MAGIYRYSHENVSVGYTQLELDSSEDPCFSYADRRQNSWRQVNAMLSLVALDTDSGEIVLKRLGCAAYRPLFHL